MTSKPLVSVFLSVYNGEQHLREAVESILNQTFRNFEFLIINDGSTDSTREILESYVDPRIKIFHQSNMGLTKSLNRGIELARGRYIARMDADDISDKERLEIQFEFMESNPRIAVCGTWTHIFGDVDNVWKYPGDHNAICCRQLFSNAIVHPSAMIRKSVLSGSRLTYNESLLRSQDYDLWVRISKKYELANLNKILLHRRINKLNVGIVHEKDQINTADMIRGKQLLDLGIDPSVEILALHSRIAQWKLECSIHFIENVLKWFEAIIKANSNTKTFDNASLKKELAFRWWTICRRSSKLGWKVFSTFWKSDFNKYIFLSMKQKIIFFIKCAIKHG